MAATTIDLDVILNSEQAKNNAASFAQQLTILQQRFGAVDTAIRQNKAELQRLQSEQKSLTTEYTKVEKSLQMQLNAFGENGKHVQKFRAQLADLQASMRDNALAIDGTKKSTRELVVEQKVLSGQMDYLSERSIKQGTNIKSLRLDLENLRNQYGSLSEAEKKAAKGTDLLNHIKKLSDGITEQEKQQRLYFGNIGNYPKIMDELNPAFQGIINSLYRVGLASRETRQSFQIFTLRSLQDIKRLGQAFISPPFGTIALILGALVVVFSAVSKAIQRNQETLDRLAVAGRRLQPLLTAIGDVFMYIGKACAYMIDFLAWAVTGFSNASTAAGKLQESINDLETAEVEYAEKVAVYTAKIAKLRAQATDTELMSIESRMRTLKEVAILEDELLSDNYKNTKAKIDLLNLERKNEHDTSLARRKEIADEIRELTNEVSRIEVQRKRNIMSMIQLNNQLQKLRQEDVARNKKYREEENKLDNNVKEARIKAERESFSADFYTQQQQSRKMFELKQKIQKEDQALILLGYEEEMKVRTNEERRKANQQIILNSAEIENLRKQQRALLGEKIDHFLKVTDIEDELTRQLEKHGNVRVEKSKIHGNYIMYYDQELQRSKRLYLEDFAKMNEKEQAYITARTKEYADEYGKIEESVKKEEVIIKDSQKEIQKANEKDLQLQKHISRQKDRMRQLSGLNAEEYDKKELSEKIKFQADMLRLLESQAKAEQDLEEEQEIARFETTLRIAQMSFKELEDEVNRFRASVMPIGEGDFIALDSIQMSDIETLFGKLDDEQMKYVQKSIEQAKVSNALIMRLTEQHEVNRINIRLNALNRERTLIANAIQDMYGTATEKSNLYQEQSLVTAIEKTKQEIQMRKDKNMEWFDLEKRLREEEDKLDEFYLNKKLDNEQATIKDRLKAQIAYFEALEERYADDGNKLLDIQNDFIRANAQASKEQLDNDLKNVNNGIIGRRKAEEKHIKNMRILYKDNADMQIELDRMELDSKQKMYDELFSLAQNWVDRSMELYSNLNDLLSQQNANRLAEAEQRNEREKTLNEDLYHENAITYEQYTKRNAQLDKDLDKEKKRLAREEAKRQKEVALFQAVVDTAAAVAAALKMTPPPVAWAMAAISGAAGAAQIATIASQPLPKLAKGGLIGGRPHSQGGTLLEAEKGEMIINKQASAEFLPLLAAINKYGSAVPFINEGSDGGFASRVNAANSALSTDTLAEAFSEAAAQIKVYTTIEDIRRGDRQYSEIESFGNI